MIIFKFLLWPLHLVYYMCNYNESAYLNKKLFTIPSRILINLGGYASLILWILMSIGTSVAGTLEEFMYAQILTICIVIISVISIYLLANLIHVIRDICGCPVGHTQY